MRLSTYEKCLDDYWLHATSIAVFSLTHRPCPFFEPFRTECIQKGTRMLESTESLMPTNRAKKGKRVDQGIHRVKICEV
jgi:hypothetical protein